MTKIRKFPTLSVQRVEGGKDAVKVVEDLISRLGFSPESCQRENTAETARWMIPLQDDKELEILIENLKKPLETTAYIGVNICTVPLRGSFDLITAALEVADGLIGVKISLVGHYLVLSASLSASGLTGEELEYYVKLINAQESWFREELIAELGWDDMPDA